MNSPFSRPLFRTNFLQHYAEGGIVSNVVGPEEQSNPLDILSGMAQQVDVTEKNLDNAQGIDQILSSFTGTQKTAADARAELAGLVGKKDAEATPDSVLALVQPAMAIMDMSRQMQPQGGIQQAPFNGPDGMPMPMEAGQPEVNFKNGVPAFAPGGEIDMNAIMARYAALEGQIPQGYAADPTSAWLALAQVGAGIAQGPTFAQGLAKGTEMAGPYMQRGLEGMNAKKSALSAFVANEVSNQEQEQRQNAQQEKIARMQIDAQARLTKQGWAHDFELEKWRREHPEMSGTQLMTEQLGGMRKQMLALPDGDPQRAILEQKIADYENVLFPADKNDPLLKYRYIVQANGGDPNDPAQVGKVIQDELHNTGDGTTDIRNAGRITELKKRIAADPNDTEAQIELKALEELVKDKGIKIDLGAKGTQQEYFDFQKRKETVYNPSIASREEQRKSIEIMKTILSIDPSKGGFETGLLPEQRMIIGQAMEMVGFQGTIPQFFNSSALGQLFDTAAQGLNVELQKDMSRGTNLTMQIIQKATANAGKSRDANKLWIDVQSKVLDWGAKNDEYLSILERTYGTDNPVRLAKLDPTNPDIQGLDFSRKPLSKLTEAEIFSPDGKPLLSYDDYVTWRQIHEPAIDDSIRNKIISVARAPANSVDLKIPGLPSSGPSATPPRTVKDYTTTPGVSVDNSKSDAVPSDGVQEMITIRGDKENEVFKYDPTRRLYIGQKTGRMIDPYTKQFVTPQVPSGR